MSFHNDPKYQLPALIQALKDHGLAHDTPSQLSDAFRIGWVAASTAASKHTPGKQCDECEGFCLIAPIDAGVAAVSSLDTDAEIIALNAHDLFFSTSESKYGADVNPHLQYHTGEPGYIEFTRHVISIVRQRCADICFSRSRSLSADGNHTAANEAQKCSSAVLYAPITKEPS